MTKNLSSLRMYFILFCTLFSIVRSNGWTEIPLAKGLSLGYKGQWSSSSMYPTNSMVYYYGTNLNVGPTSLWVCNSIYGCNSTFAPGTAGWGEIPLYQGSSMAYTGNYNNLENYSYNQLVYYSSSSLAYGSTSLYSCTNILGCIAGTVPSNSVNTSYWKEIPLQQGNTGNNGVFSRISVTVDNTTTAMTVTLNAVNGQPVSSSNPVRAYFRKSNGEWYTKTIVNVTGITVYSFTNVLGLIPSTDGRAFHVYLIDCNPSGSSACVGLSLDWYKSSSIALNTEAISVSSTNPTAVYTASSHTNVYSVYVGKFTNQLTSTSTAWSLTSSIPTVEMSQPGPNSNWWDFGKIYFSGSISDPTQPTAYTNNNVIARRKGNSLELRFTYYHVPAVYTGGIGFICFRIPGNMEIDTSITPGFSYKLQNVPAGSTIHPITGLSSLDTTGALVVNSNTVAKLTAEIYNSKNIAMMVHQSDGGVYYWITSNPPPGQDGGMTRYFEYPNLALTINVNIPVAGWYSPV
jgi:hypothetical protein